MSKTPSPFNEMALVLRRIGAAGPLLGFAMPEADLRHNLLLKPEDFTGNLVKFGKMSARLVRVLLTPGQKGRLRKLTSGRYRAALRAYVTAVGLVPGILGPAAAPAWPSPDRMTKLADLMGSYEAIGRSAQTILARGMDQRLLMGAFAFYLLKLVLGVVQRRIEDPATPESERSKLQNAFSALLLRRERVLMTAEQRRAQDKLEKDKLKGQISEVERRTMILDAIQAMKMGVKLDPDTMAQVALYYEEELAKQQAPAPVAKGRHAAKPAPSPGPAAPSATPATPAGGPPPPPSIPTGARPNSRKTGR